MNILPIVNDADDTIAFPSPIFLETGDTFVDPTTGRVWELTGDGWIPAPAYIASSVHDSLNRINP